jgi:hypothetical protein
LPWLEVDGAWGRRRLAVGIVGDLGNVVAGIGLGILAKRAIDTVY